MIRDRSSRCRKSSRSIPSSTSRASAGTPSWSTIAAASCRPPRPGNSLAPDPLRRKEELEGFALDALRMVGTLEQNQTRWGLIRTPNGILHRVRVGNYLGMNNGQIINISDEAIQLTEIVSEGPGEWRERQATVALTQ